MTILLQLVTAVCVVGAMVFGLRRSNVVRINTVKVAVPTVWALDHHCRGIGYLLAEAPGLRSVEIYLGDLFLADSSSVALLTYAHRLLLDAHVELSISATPAVVRTLVASGLPAVNRGAKEQAAPRSTMLN